MAIQPPPDDKAKNNGDELRSARRRLLIVLAFALGIIIYSYGWTVTEIDLDLPQEERRQTNVTIALRELLSPNIFDQKRELSIYTTPFLLDCSTGEAPAQAFPDDASGGVIVEPSCADSDETVTFTVQNVEGNAEARVRWLPPAEDDQEEARPRPLEIIETEREDFIIGAEGRYTGQFEVPRIRGGEGQIHEVRVLVAVPTGPIRLTETAMLVIDRMLQTIFMALVATTVAIPIAAVISFFAARNLMREIRLSLGSLLLTFVALVVGGYLGQLLLTPFAQLGVRIGRGDVGGSFGALVAFIVPIAVLIAVISLLNFINRGTTRKDKHHTEENQMTQTLNTVVTSLALIFMVGAIGGLGLLGGEQISALSDQFRPDGVENWRVGLVNATAFLIGSVGNFLTILGSLTELALGIVTFVLVGFALSSIINSWFGNALRRIPESLNLALGAVLGGISGTFLMMAMGVLGTWAALMGLFPPLVAGILGGQITLLIATRLGVNQRLSGRTRTIARRLSMIVGLVAVFLLTFEYLSINRALVNGILPPQQSAIVLGMELPFNSYILRAGVLGLVLGTIGGGLAGVKASFPLGDVLYNISRTTLNMVRSIEPLIMGLVFVVWVGIGPFAGVLALTLHSIAALGKLYSEQIENIDSGPLEALQSTGANRLQTIIYAVIPQIIPPYIAFTMYRWDINVRMSTIIGFVGGGGIGLLLQQQINLLRYREAGVAVLAIAIVVSILDYASASIRERLV
jgi:phosphonate ABC transporter permease subunit PhnE